MRGRKRHCAAVAGRQCRLLATVATMPDRPHRMDDVADRQPVTLGDLGVASGTAAQRAAFGQQLGAGGAMNRAVDATTAQQRSIRRVDDGIDIKCRDVSYDNVVTCRADLSCERRQAGAPRVTPLSANIFCNSPAWNISRMMSQPPTNSPLT